jgi:hypothetical protein
MAYIKKNTSGLINTRITDIGRQKMSQGNFKISYFQIGDSEVVYNKIPTYNQSNSFVLEPAFNSQNGTYSPQTNKQNVKYPVYVSELSGATYGIPFMDSMFDSVFNRAAPRGFFTGNTTATTINWSAFTSSNYVSTPNYVVNMSSLSGTNQIEVYNLNCNPTITETPQVGDFITIYYDGLAVLDCSCSNLPTPTPTISPTASQYQTPTPTPTVTSSGVGPCTSPTATPTPTKTTSAPPTTTGNYFFKRSFLSYRVTQPSKTSLKARLEVLD